VQWQDQHLNIDAHLRDQVLNRLAIWHLTGVQLEEVPGVCKTFLAD